MPIKFLGLLTGGLLLVSAVPATAAPVTVNLRVEGPSTTLFEGPVTTDVRDFQFNSGSDTSPHACAGQAPFSTASSPQPTRGAAMTAAALGGGMTMAGSFSSTLGPSWTTINGVSVAFDSASGKFFAEYKNGQFASSGSCGDVIAAGDDVLFAYADGSEPLLKLAGAAIGAPGGSVKLKVTNAGTGAAVDGATVGGATTDANGEVTVGPLSSGTNAFKASKTGSIRSNLISVCATNGNDGLCGSPPCKTTGKDGLCGTTDTTKPAIEISSIKNDQVFRKVGPRELKGVASDSTGVKQVRIRITQIVGKDTKRKKKSCAWFSPSRAKFVKSKRCRAKHAPFFEVSKAGSWSYLLPSDLGKGRYVLDVEVSDGAGNTSDFFKNGVNRVKFRVV